VHGAVPDKNKEVIKLQRLIRRPLARGQKVNVTLSGADYLCYQIYGDHPLVPVSHETQMKNAECAAPETPEELRARARALGNKKTKNARGRRWWEQR
jgi:hypothetical protein